MEYAIGSLVKVRGREWVILEKNPPWLKLRPLGGGDEETTAIHTNLETIQSAQFAPPNPDASGDYTSCRLLRDAVRLGFRSSAGPFRAIASIAVQPRSYQLVPLLMALKQDPVRLLIADDVGIGKTIEACLIAKELLERGEVKRLAVLCPPHLAEQWHTELKEKFHIDAALVLRGTATKLERNLRLGESLFDRHPFVIVSMDFIKSDRRRDDFLRTCPELVIVDEAHTCSWGGEGKRHQRHQLVSELSQDVTRHMLLVTATPHSGKEDAFHSLLGLLNSRFVNFPTDLAGAENQTYRREIANHFVQRRRGDIRSYIGEDTPFPDRESTEVTYSLNPDYKNFFAQVFRYARETVLEEKSGTYQFRIRWWSVLALLRALASSPAAAASTLRNRASTLDQESGESIEELGRRNVMDLTDDDSVEGSDVAPGSDIGELFKDAEAHKRKLRAMAKTADSLLGNSDEKLNKSADIISSLLKDGFRPIVFCRFIPTVDYLVEMFRNHNSLNKKFKGVEIIGVTGQFPPLERKELIQKLAQYEKRLLICTDCLSEGINLQEHFDAVVHYDLSWNPARHEQREGRVDRFGQPRKVVKVVTYYGTDNQIDGIVLDVLLRKHKNIKSSLGISVPVPVNSEALMEAVFEGLLLREETGTSSEMLLPGFEEYFKPQREELFKQWEFAKEKEKRSQTMFAQHAIKPEEVVPEIQAIRMAIGYETDVSGFTRNALTAFHALISGQDHIKVDLFETPQEIKDMINQQKEFKACFTMPAEEGELYLNRTHPIVEALASHVLNSTLDYSAQSIARRCGVIRTNSVEKRTTLLLTRFRYQLITRKEEEQHSLLSEECLLLAFEGAPDKAVWLDEDQAEALLNSTPDANVLSQQALEQLQKIIIEENGVYRIHQSLLGHLNDVALNKGKQLLESHKKVRQASGHKGIRQTIEPQLPPDILGVYIYLPIPKV
ncbi:helicase-related protein [Deltaproteobacteria bacterium TL4]